MSNFKITRNEWIFILCTALLGLLLTSRKFLLWLDTLNSFNGLLVYYAIVSVILFSLSKFGIIIWNIRIEKPLQVIGMLLIVFSFFIVVDWESPYIQYVTGHTEDDVSPILYQSEDGSTFYLWSQVIPPVPENMEKLRLLTYVVTPVGLGLLGALLVKRKISLSAL